MEKLIAVIGVLLCIAGGNIQGYADVNEYAMPVGFLFEFLGCFTVLCCIDYARKR